MDSSTQDKNLPATPQRLKKARQDGQVARSKDLSNLAVLGVLTSVVSVFFYLRIVVPMYMNDEVAPGRVITVRFVDFGDEETFLLGSREEAAHASVEVYSPTSPLGQAVLGARIGDTVSYELANGKKVTVEIIAAQPYAG